MKFTKFLQQKGNSVAVKTFENLTDMDKLLQQVYPTVSLRKGRKRDIVKMIQRNKDKLIESLEEADKTEYIGKSLLKNSFDVDSIVETILNNEEFLELWNLKNTISLPELTDFTKILLCKKNVVKKVVMRLKTFLYKNKVLINEKLNTQKVQETLEENIALTYDEDCRNELETEKNLTNCLTNEMEEETNAPIQDKETRDELGAENNSKDCESHEMEEKNELNELITERTQLLCKIEKLQEELETEKNLRNNETTQLNLQLQESKKTVNRLTFDRYILIEKIRKVVAD